MSNTVPLPYAPSQTIDQERPHQRHDSWDAMRIEQRIVSVPADQVFDAVLNADLRDVPRESPLVRALFALRSMAERAVSFVLREPATSPPPFGAIRIADLRSRGEWVMLGKNAPNQVSFGAIGRFWDGETRWVSLDAKEFDSFSRPGYAKIRCDIRVLPLGDALTAVTYECRTFATDPASRRGFLRYWRVVSPFVGVVLRATLALVERRALELECARFR